MGLFRKSAWERTEQAKRTQARADKAVRRGNIERGIQLGVKALRQQENTHWSKWGHTGPTGR